MKNRISHLLPLRLILIGLAATLLISCQGLDQGLSVASLEGEGPAVVFDFDAKPLPEIPFPNNLATVLDENSPTGRRLNFSVIAPTLLESDLRDKILQLDGFGTFQPITVKFDKPLYLPDIVERHHDANLEPTNDAIYLVNISPESPKFGMATPLDVGQGNFPVLMQPILGDIYTPERNVCKGYLPEREDAPENPYSELIPNVITTGYFNHCDMEWGNTIPDPHIAGTNLLFESHDEDLNGNGILDIGEDIDDDGVLDKPNVIHEGDDPARDLIGFYEKESNILVMRPLLALEEETTYAVVLTKRLRGEKDGEMGDSIRSPFHAINHLKQTEELAPLETILAGGFVMEGDSEQRRISLSMDDVAFTWSFSTQSITKELIDIRKGMYGVGPHSYLEDEFPPVLSQIDQMTLLDEDNEETTSFDERNQYLLPIGNLKEILNIAGVMLLQEMVGPEHAQESVTHMLETLGSVDYIVSGRFDTPYFLVDKDGIGTEEYAGDDNESFEYEEDGKRWKVGTDEVTWWCAVPRETEVYKQPFPVTVYSHGYSGNRFETIGFASLMARYGMATCGIDSVGHGLVIPPKFLEDPIVVGLLDKLKVTPTMTSISTGRARDLNNDGMPDSGGDFWTADSFHTRDIVRQSVIDTMQFIRIMRNFGVKADAPDECYGMSECTEECCYKWTDNASGADVYADSEEDVSVWQDSGKHFVKGVEASPWAGDFNNDGVPDFGGALQDYYPWGQSLGGFVTTLLAAAEPAVVAGAPVSGGAGLIDVGLRTIQEGVIQAVFLAFMGPFVYAQPVPDSNQISFGFIVPDNTRWWGTNDGVHDYYMRDFARTNKDLTIVPGNRVVIINEVSGDEWHCTLSEDLICRTGFAADAMDGVEKRHHMGMPDDWYYKGTVEITPPRDGEVTFYEPTAEEFAEMTDLEKSRYDEIYFPDASKVGDVLRIEVRRLEENEAGEMEWVTFDTIDRWAQNTGVEKGGMLPGGFYQGFFYKPGDRLVAPRDGLGKKRQTPDFRRMMGISSMILEPADPAPWSRHMFERPMDFSDVPIDAKLIEYRKELEAKAGAENWERHANMLVIPTSGDMNVPIATEVALARTTGILELYKSRDEWNNTFCESGSYSENDMLIKGKVLEAIDELHYFDNACMSEPRALNFDADNLDNGLDGENLSAPSPSVPMRATIESRAWEATESSYDRRPAFEGDENTMQGVWTNPYGITAMRIPYLEKEGVHGFVTPCPYKEYDIDQHMINMIGRYFQCRGNILVDDECLATSTCDYFNDDDFAVPPEEYKQHSDFE